MASSNSGDTLTTTTAMTQPSRTGDQEPQTASVSVPAPAPTHKCKTCSATFSTQEALAAHTKSSHGQGEPYLCQKCGSVTFHRGEEPVKCRTCESLQAAAKPSVSVQNIVSTDISTAGLNTSSLAYPNFNNYAGLDSSQLAVYGLPYVQQPAPNDRWNTVEIFQMREKVYTCDECRASFSTLDSLKEHLATHTAVKPYQYKIREKQFNCNECTASFSRQESLTEHMSTHVTTGTSSGYSSSPVKQEGNGVYSDQDRLKELATLAAQQPYQSQPPDKQPYICAECGSAFTDQASFNQHLATHAAVKSFFTYKNIVHSCNICGLHFQDEVSLKNHLVSHATDSAYNPFEVYSCDKCNSKFPTEANLKDHILAAHGVNLSKDIVQCEENFNCDECGVTFNDEDSLIGHLATHATGKVNAGGNSDDEELNCTQCGETFREEEDLKEHLISHAAENKKALLAQQQQLQLTMSAGLSNGGNLSMHHPIISHMNLLKCGICTAVFSDMSSLHKHELAHSLEAAVSFQCNVCNVRFDGQKEMEQHMLTHIKPRLFQCSQCPERFTQREMLEQHFTAYHVILKGAFPDHADFRKQRKRKLSGDKPYSCKICGASYSYRSGLYAHKKVHSKDALKDEVGISLTNEQPIIDKTATACDVCGEVFVTNDDLELHKRSHAVGKVKLYRCDTCGDAFRQLNDLQNHKQFKHGPLEEPLFKCDICRATFMNNNGLSQHMRSHGGDRAYKCTQPECDASFNSKAGLARHIRTHTGEKPYRCEDCRGTFSDRNGLISHMRIHTGEKPFKCEVCSSTFRASYTLKCHKRTHTGEKPYKCSECTAAFTQPHSLKTHIKTQHS